MTEPCSEKQNIDKLFDYHDENMCKLHTMEVRQVEIAGDVLHIKTRIDNGMSHTIKRIDENLVALKPVIEHHSDIIRRIEDMGWLVSKMVGVAFLTSIAGVIVWAITKGFVIK